VHKSFVLAFVIVVSPSALSSILLLSPLLLCLPRPILLLLLLLLLLLQVEMVAFGAPFVGNDAWTEEYYQLVNSRHLIFVGPGNAATADSYGVRINVVIITTTTTATTTTTTTTITTTTITTTITAAAAPAVHPFTDHSHVF